MGAPPNRAQQWTLGDEVSEQVVDELVDRAGSGYDRWIEQVEHTGYCVKPIRLVGRTEQVDSETSEVRVAYDTRTEPDSSLLIACGDRKESRQIDLLAGAAGEYGVLIYVLAYGGLRRGEASALRRGRCDLLRARIEVAESLADVSGELHFGPTKSYARRWARLP
jgi:hypothetical protein